MLKIKIDDWYDLHNGFTLTLNPGYTAIVGPNGAGKTTLLQQIKEYADKHDIPVWRYSNTWDGMMAKDTYIMRGQMELAATTMTSSEGEQVAINFGQAVSKLGRFVNKTKNKGEKKIIILLDAIDSGASIDRARDILDFINMVIKDEKDREVYIVMAVNHYELAKAPIDCVHARTGQHRVFIDYDTYAKFIINFDLNPKKESE